MNWSQKRELRTLFLKPLTSIENYSNICIVFLWVFIFRIKQDPFKRHHMISFINWSYRIIWSGISNTLNMIWLLECLFLNSLKLWLCIISCFKKDVGIRWLDSSFVFEIQLNIKVGGSEVGSAMEQGVAVELKLPFV